jgi:hypothetical protein
MNDSLSGFSLGASMNLVNQSVDLLEMRTNQSVISSEGDCGSGGNNQN